MSKLESQKFLSLKVPAHIGSFYGSSKGELWLFL